MKKIALILLTAFTVCTSCNNDDNNNNGTAPGNSRVVRYELTGNFTGNIIASYTTASGGTVNEQVNALPWNKDVTYETNVTGATMAISGNGGVAGQQITIAVKRGGSQVGTPTTATANSSGGISTSLPTIVF